MRALAAALHARFAIELDAAGRPDPSPFTDPNPTNQQATLWQAVSTGTVPRETAMLQDSDNYTGTLYVATPALLRAFGIAPGQVSPDADILTARAGLAGVPDLELLGQGDIVTHMNPPGHEVSETHLCPPRSCIARPRIQTITSLPAGTSAPSTVLTEHAVRALGEQLVPDGWLIQTAAPLTPGQVSTARQAAAKAGTRIETSTGQPSGAQLKDGATAAGLLIALAVLAMTAGLVRAETASDLRTLTAAGAGPAPAAPWPPSPPAPWACSARCSARPPPTSPSPRGRTPAWPPPSARCRPPTWPPSWPACRWPPLWQAACSPGASRPPLPASRSSKPC